MAKIASAILTVLFLAFAGADSANGGTLGCEGDSQTAARTPVTDAQTWCALVAARLGWSHVNFAVGGSTTQDVINRLPTDLLTPVDCWVIQIGANDSFIPATTNVAYPPEWTAPIVPPAPGVSVAQFETNLASIYNAIHAATGAPVTFMTQWAFFENSEIVQEQFYADAMKDTAARLGVPFVDVFQLQLGGVWWNYQNDKSSFSNRYLVDSQHPSAAGHAWEAQQFTFLRYQASCAYHP